MVSMTHHGDSGHTLLGVIYTPLAGRGRPPIVGTVLEADDQYCLVRRVFSGAENAGNTGSPRTEIWVALRRRDMAPAIVRRTGDFGWQFSLRSEHSWSDRPVVQDVLERMGYEMSDVWPGSLAPDWPATIWDRRVILPDDERWKGAKADPVAASVRELLALRNTCPDDEVWRIDARILGLARREKPEPVAA